MKKRKWILPVSIVGGVLILCIAAVFIFGMVMPAIERTEAADIYDFIERTEAADIYDFNAQYIRTGGGHEDVEYPVVKIIRSVDELNAYYNANKDKYSLERRTDPASDSTIGFLDACDKYDEAYFEDQILVMVLLKEGSGSIRHEVRSIAWSEQNKKLTVYIESIVPEIGTADVAEWHILVEPESIVKVDSGDDVTVILDGVDPHTQSTIASHSRGYANIRLTVPKGWEYTTEDVEGSNDFSIVLWHKNSVEDKIRISYQTAFGVCGTGLEEKDITIGSYQAWQGTYDNHKNWDYIALKDTPGSYVIFNEADDDWWKEHKDETMQILNTLVVAENIISESEAITIAKDNAAVDYNEVRASFDMEKGEWSVNLYKKNTDGGDQTVIITSEGKVIESIPGE